MAETPVIETARLRILSFGARHLTSRYVGWLNDAEVVRFSDQRFCRHTEASCRAYLKSFEGTPHYFWAIELKDDRVGHVGNMNAYVDIHHGTADVGILIGEKSAWGQGYGLEAWIAVCQWLLSSGNVRKVTAGTLSVNKPMLAIMRKSGMVPDGSRHRQCLFEGREVDVVYACVFRENMA